MSEKHLPKWRRSYSKEMAAAAAVVGALQSRQGLTFGDAAELIAVHMGTATEAEVDAYRTKVQAATKHVTDEDLAALGDV